MKITFATLLALVALQVCYSANGEEVNVTVKSSSLNDDEAAIIEGFLSLVQALIKPGNALTHATELLARLKTRIETKLATRGQEYLDLLAATLTKVKLSEEIQELLFASLQRIGEEDGTKIPSRSKRSPTYGKKSKKGKKKCGK